MRRLLLAALLLPLAACGGLSNGSQNGYSSGTGQVVQYAVDKRDSAVDLSGDDLTGHHVDVTDYRGKPVVVVVWGSWCTECNADAADVAAAARQLGATAQFVGIDIRDPSEDNARAYERGYDVSYPSIYDPSSTTLLSFPGELSPKTVPAFAVLDAQGRVAAAIVGKLPSELTLVELVKQVAQEASA